MAARREFDLLELSEDGDVLCVRMNRPPANALSPDLLAEGHAVLEQIAAARPAAVIIAGTEPFFSGGVDLKIAPTLTPAGQAEMVEGINRLFSGWYELPLPVVAAVNGHAVAGGLILALCADLRVAASEASFGLTEARVGIPYPAAAMLTVRAELAPAVARRLVLEAELIDADRALAWGVVDELAPGDAVLDRARRHASALAALPARAYAEVKRQLRGETIAAMRSAIASDPMAKGWISAESAAAADRALS